MKLLSFALLLALLSSTHPLFATEHAIDTARSTITIHVGKTGLFSAAGHEHTVIAPVAEGAIDDSEPGRVRFTVKASSLTVQPEKDQAEVQRDMQTKVLESETYPEIRFESTSVRRLGDEKWTVTGNLTLHGTTNPVTAEVRKTGAGYEGQASLRQSQFGIKPVSAAGRTVKVKDELKLEFLIREK